MKAKTAREAIRQTRPFGSAGQEALITLLMTAQAVRWPLAKLVESAAQISLPQYNVLRILRGAGPDGLPVLEIAARMVERVPGVTRLLDRLESSELVSRTRTTHDRRQVVCRLTKAGERLLKRLDPQVDARDAASFAALDAGEIQTLIRLLNRVRVALG